MKYELAKELKDAGFPQLGDGGYAVDNDYHDKHRPDCGCMVYIPTLEELIEACGKPFMSLYRNDDGSGWTAFKFGDRIFDGNLIEGDTPTEAVTRLWLTLNEKSAPVTESA